MTKPNVSVSVVIQQRWNLWMESKEKEKKSAEDSHASHSD